MGDSFDGEFTRISERHILQFFYFLFFHYKNKRKQANKIDQRH